MSLLSNLLQQNMVTLKTATIGRSSLFKAGVIKAVVLSSSPLFEKGKVISNQFQISLQPQVNNNPLTPTGNLLLNPSTPNIVANTQANQTAVLEIISKQPLAVGSKIHIQLNGDNTAKILQITDLNGKVLGKLPSTTQTTLSGNLPGNLSGNKVTQSQPSTTGITASSLKAAKHPTNIQNGSAPLAKIVEPPQLTIDKALRLALPQQQTLKSLIPLLQQLSTSTEQKIPKTIVNSIKSLLASIPNTQQAQDPKQLKRALLNSGPFLESKLNRLVTDQHNRNRHQGKLSSEQLAKLPTPEQYRQRDGAIIQADSKAKTQQLVRQIEHAIGKPLHSQTAKSINTSSTDEVIKSLYDPNQVKPQESATATANNISNNATSKENIDILLQQLGRQLLATLAKTQLNQLDTLSQRAQPSNETTTNTQTWTLEIPIMQGKQVDNVEVQINQEESQDEKHPGQKQWQVMLSFDLHKLGKMNVELIIIKQSVTATVWSELESAHYLVRKEIEGFRQGLEKIGVNVTKVDCKIGMPKTKSNNLQPLVDVRT